MRDLDTDGPQGGLERQFQHLLGPPDREVPGPALVRPLRLREDLRGLSEMTLGHLVTLPRTRRRAPRWLRA